MNEQSNQQQGPSLVPTMNGGSSSIKVALFELIDEASVIERILRNVR